MGFDCDYEIFNYSESVLNLVYGEDELKVKKAGKTNGNGLRVIRDGRIGFSYFQENEREAFETAKQCAKFSPKTDFSFAPKQKMPKVKTFSKKTSGLGASECSGLVGQIIDGMNGMDSKRVILETAKGAIGIRNSNNLDEAYDYTSFSVYCETTFGKGSGFAYYSGLEAAFEPEELGERAAEMAREMDKSRKIDPGEYRVIFSKESMHDLLGFLLQSFSGELKRKNATKVVKGKEMFSEMLTVVEDGRANGSMARPFDDEGVPSAERILVEDGLVKELMYNRETAALEGVKEDGFCIRGDYSSRPGVGRSNVKIAEGKSKNPAEEIGKHLLVESFHGIHTSNSTTGDFGLEVSVAKLVNGAEETPTRGCTISGNIFNLFNSILLVGSKSETFDDMKAPTIVFDKITVVS